MKRIQIERVFHRGAERIALRFTYDEELISITRKLPGARWSSSMRCWHIDGISDPVHTIFEAFRGKALLDYSRMRKLSIEKSDNEAEIAGKLSDEGKGNRSIMLSSDLSLLSNKGREDIEKYSRWMAANRYPESTIRTYSTMMIKFLQFVKPCEADECTEVDLTGIVSRYVLPNGLSQSYQNQLISSIKKFYTYIYNKTIDPCSLERPRPKHCLPNVLSKDEVKKILLSIKNEKHRTILSFIYACGLRRSELINLMPADIEKSRGLVRIRQAKGFKDRIVPVSEKTLQMIDNYVLHYKPEKIPI